MKKIIISLAIIVAVIGTASSCKKYLDGAYKNPNLPTSAPPEQVLLSCIANMHYGMAFDARQLGFYTQNFASVVGLNQWERQGYLLTGGSGNQGSDVYRMHYWNMGFNIIDMIDSSKLTGKFDYTAAAFSLNAWSWLVTADCYGEMPVKQAFEKGRLSFDYDNQDVAYNLALSYCDSAQKYWALAAAMPTSTLAVGDQYFFGGNQGRWVKFVNGLRARLYSRWGNKAGFLTNRVDSVIKYVDLAMSSTTDDAFVRFNINFPLSNSRNFFGPTRNNVGGFRVGAFPVNILNGTVFDPTNTFVDPRANYMFRPSPDGIHRGILCNQQADNGTTPTDRRVPSFWGTVAQTAAPTGGIDTGARTFFKNDAPFPIMTYSELQFLKAEMLFRKGLNTAAKMSYENGINGHFDMLNTHFTGYLQTVGANSPAVGTHVPIPATSRTAFLANANFNPPANALSLRHIMCEKYIACYGWGFGETWVDLRKYDYDTANIYKSYVILPLISLFPDNAGKQAQRIRPRYDSEYLWNIPALQSVGGFAMDYHTKKTWFAQP